MSSSTESELTRAARSFEGAWRSAPALARRAVRVRASLQKTPLFRMPSPGHAVQVQVPFARANRGALIYEYRRRLATESLPPNPSAEVLIRAATAGRERAWRQNDVSVFEGRNRVHIGEPTADVDARMQVLLKAFQSVRDIDDVAEAHLTILGLHPLIDGNGHLARSVSALMVSGLAGADCRPLNLVAQLDRARRAYFDAIDRRDRSLLARVLYACFVAASRSDERQLVALGAAMERVGTALSLVGERRRRELLTFGWTIGPYEPAAWEHPLECGAVQVVFRDAASGVDLVHAPEIAAALEIPYFFTTKQSDWTR
jgi:hypothetical protein